MTSQFVRVLMGYLHVLGVATYLGGALVMELVVGPAQKAIPPAQAQVMGKKTADRFLWLAWGALGLIAASGVLRLFSTRSEKVLFSESLWSSAYGRTLLAMVVLWFVLVVNGSIITFVLRPRLTGRNQAGVSAAQVAAHQQVQVRAAEWIQRLTRADLVIAFVVAYLGMSLRFGGIEQVV